MGLESATYINQLVDTNPVGGTDGVDNGDDHLRLIKSVLKNQFPSLGNAAVNATASELNALTSTNLMPIGIIILWSGNINSLPSGWVLCNGGNGTPDMRNRFLVGAGSTYGINATGGDDRCRVSGNTNNHTLSTSQMPSHNHTIRGRWQWTWWGGDGDGRTKFTNFKYNNSAVETANTSSTGSNSGHSHGTNLSGGTNSNFPSYYAVAYIMKTS